MRVYGRTLSERRHDPCSLKVKNHSVAGADSKDNKKADIVTTRLMTTALNI